MVRVRLTGGRVMVNFIKMFLLLPLQINRENNSIPTRSNGIIFMKLSYASFFNKNVKHKLPKNVGCKPKLIFRNQILAVFSKWNLEHVNSLNITLQLKFFFAFFAFPFYDYQTLVKKNFNRNLAPCIDLNI